jgi:hypothetical protein
MPPVCAGWRTFFEHAFESKRRSNAVDRDMLVMAKLLDERINQYQRMAWKRGLLQRSLLKWGAGVTASTWNGDLSTGEQMQTPSGERLPFVRFVSPVERFLERDLDLNQLVE